MTIQVLASKDVPRREIARQLGVTEGTVRYHLRRSGAVDGRRDKLWKAGEKQQVIETWWAARLEDRERPPNVRELHELLVEKHEYTGSYQSVRRFVRARFGPAPIRTYRRVETPPGAQSQTDWGEFPSVDLGDGPESLSAFVMVLSSSRMPAIVWSRSKDQLSWLGCHNGAYLRLGGVAATNRIDNVKTALSRGAGCWSTVHPTYAAYARVMRFHVDACQPRCPEAKGKSEAKVRLSRLLTPIVGERYGGGIDELQHRTDERIQRWARRATCPATGMTVYDSWQAERDFLGQLPDPLPEPFDVSVDRPVRRDCMVSFEGRQYSVPFGLVDRQVEVRGGIGKVQIYFGDELVREYPRGTPERILIDPTCYEGEGPEHVIAPPPLGRMAGRLQEIYEMAVETRPLDYYEALAEVAR